MEVHTKSSTRSRAEHWRLAHRAAERLGHPEMAAVLLEGSELRGARRLNVLLRHLVSSTFVTTSGF